MLTLHRPSSLRITAATAILFVLGALVTPLVAPASAAVASVSFQQCANDNNAPHACSWINGDIGPSNSVYAEGMSLPQRLMLTNIAATVGNAHTLVFTTQWTKAGKHAYDWLTSYSQAQAAASFYGIPYTSLNECAGLGATCTGIRSGSNYVDVPVPDDSYLSQHGGTQSRINAYETQFGNRTVRLWGSGLSATNLTMTHSAGSSADTGDSIQTWTLTWTGSSDVLLEFAAHIAKASGSTGWGANTGAGAINGSPYHVSLGTLDGSSIGSQDNQMKASVLVAASYLKVVKVLSPSSDPGTFNLQIDGVTKATGGDGTSTGFVQVLDGQRTVGETAASGTSLSDYTSSTSCSDGTTSSTGSATVTVNEGDSITCTITNTRKTGTLKVVKVLSPTNDPGLFNLLIDGTVRATDQSHNGSTPTVTVNTGTHTVGETAGTGTSMSNYSSSVSCLNGAASVTATATTGGWSVPVADNANVVCTITNTRQTGTLTVNKVFSPTTDPGLVNLSIDGVDRVSDVGNGGTTGAITVNTATTHSVGESAGTGTALSDYTSSISCSDGSSGTGTSLSGITVTNASNVTCTITNTRKTGTLQVLKALSPSTDPGTFDLTVDGTTQATGVGNGGGTSVLTLPTGSHSFAEAAASGTSLTDYTASVSCTGGATPTAGGGGWSVTLTENQNVVCTITNTRKTGTLQVLKATVPTNDPGRFDLLVDGTTRVSDVANGGGTTAITVPTGDHTFAEAAGTGTTLTQYSASASCADGRTPVAATLSNGTWTVPVGDGQAVVCTITNTHSTGSLSVTKSVVGANAPAGGFVFNVACSLGTWSLSTTLTFTGSGTQTVSGILAGATCTVSETPVSGWTSSPGSATATISAGATSLMTFTNTRDTGTLQIAKHAIGHSTAEGTFTFDVSCADATGLSAVFNGVTVTTDATGDGLSSVLSGIPSSSTCTVTERSAPGWRDDSGARTVVVGTGQLATVSFTNTQLYTDLALVKGVDVDGDGPDDNGALVQPGTPLVYTLTYTNSGNTAATGVVISDTLPANSTFDSIADGGTFDAASGVAAWIVDVAAGQTASVHWTVVADLPSAAGQTIDNVATFVAPDNSGSSNPVSNPLPFGDLTLVKAVSPTSTVEYGDTLTYSLTAVATGSLDQHSVVITDVIPTGTTYVAGSAACTGTPCTASYDAATKTVTWAVGDLAAGASRAVSFQVTIDTPPAAADGAIPATVIRNSGLVESAETPSTPSNRVDTPVTTVLGVKVVRKPPVKVLPFTGIPLTEGVAWAIGMVLLGAAVTASARRPKGAHRH